MALKVVEEREQVTLEKVAKNSRTSSRSDSKKKEDEVEMVWREDRGKTSLVPLIPEPRKEKKLLDFTMKEVSEKNSREACWIIIDGRVYDITKFITLHPGGQHVLIQMAGKDCTDAFASVHQARIYKNMLPAYLIGTVTDVPVYKHLQDFRALRQELLRDGMFETDFCYYFGLGLFLASLFATSLYLSLVQTSTTAHLCGALVMGAFWQQFGGLSHDFGHSAVFHNFRLDHLAGSVLGSSLTGISTAWWKLGHNSHHVMSNSIEHDPNIQHLPLMALHKDQMGEKYFSSYYRWWCDADEVAAKVLVSNQHLFFWPLMMVARFNLYAQSIITLINSKERLQFRYLELACEAFFFTWVVALAWQMNSWAESVAWVLMSHAVAGLLHVQLVVSHWIMHMYHGSAYNDESDTWFQMQLKTTCNIYTPRFADYLHIGIQFQIEHHLFPTMPRHNLRAASKKVRALCKKYNVDYNCPGFLEGCGTLHNVLRENAMRARKGDLPNAENILKDALNAVG